MPLIDLGSGVKYEPSTTGSGTGNYSSFLRLGANDDEIGFNTNTNNLADNKNGIWTHAVQVGTLATVNIGGVDYYEIRLDLNEVQSGDKPNIHLDDLRIFRSAAGATATDYANDFSGLTEVFNLAPGGLDLVDTNHGSGTDDYVFYVPTSLFTNPSQYFTLYADFHGSDDGFEEFRAKSVDFTPQPDIGILKETNGTDDTCSTILVGQTVTWTYTVENNGNVALTNVVVTDDNGTPGNTADDFHPTGVLSGGFNVGDINHDNILDTTETWLYSATGTAQAGEYANIATVSGAWAFGGASGTVQSQEEDCYYGATPGIGIVKMTNGLDDQCPTILIGKDVTWTYNVTNKGDIALHDVVVTDDNGTPLDDTDDFNPDMVLGLDGTHNIGDVNNDGILDLTETWQYTAAGIAQAGEYENTAKADGTATDDSNNSETVHATEEDCYFGATPEIAIVKMTNGTDDTCPDIIAGSAVTWTYSVTNPGDIALANVVVMDDNGTPLDDTDDFAPDAVLGLDGTHNIGDVNNDGILDLTETWQYTAAGTAQVGEYENTATVSGDATDQFNNSTTVNDDEDDCYYGATPSIGIVKLTNETDGECHNILVGQTVTWTYNVTNTSDADIPIGAITITDDNGTSGTGDDFHPTAVMSGAYNIGDTNFNDLLDIGETWKYTWSAAAVAGEYENNATVNGTAEDSFHNTAPVTNSDDDCYFGANPDIDIVKLTNGTDDLCPVLSVGDAVTWTYNVTNSGNVSLTNIVITDDNGTDGVPGDDFHPDQVLAGLYNVGDTNTDGVFDPGETWVYQKTDVVHDGHYDNIAYVSGDYTDDFSHSTTVHADEDDCYVGVSGPGVRTPGFWSNPKNGGEFWDGKFQLEKHAGEKCFPFGELTRTDTNHNGKLDSGDSAVSLTVNGVKGLLIGDWDMNGVQNGTEDTIFISLDAANILINASQKDQQDGRFVVGRDLVATWLNYLAGNPIGEIDGTDGAYSPKEAIQDAIDFLQTYGDNTFHNGILTGSGKIVWDGAAVKQGSTTWGSIGSPIHSALDGYNNTGMIDGVGYAHNCDGGAEFMSMMTGFAVHGDIISM